MENVLSLRSGGELIHRDKIFGERGSRLLSPNCRADEDARVFGQTGFEPLRHFVRLFVALFGQCALHVGLAVLRFRMAPKYEVHILCACSIPNSNLNPAGAVMKVKHLLHCHLLVPGIFPELAADAPRLPGLENLLVFAGSRQIFEGGAEAWLCRAFGAARQDDWPVAPLTAMEDGLAPEKSYWLRVDPVHLHLLRDSLTMADCKPFDLTAEEAQSLLATLNRHFAADGLRFVAPVASRWYLQLPRPAALVTHPLSEVVGRDVGTCLPQGGDAMQWHGWITEAQMLLHDHPVNQERERRGLLPVNSIWPWGGGVLERPSLAPYQGVWSSDHLARALARSSGSEIRSTPVSADAWLDEVSAAGTHLIVLDVLDDPELRQHTGSWLQSLQHLDNQWFTPLLSGLKSGRISRIHLHLAAPRSVRSFAVERAQLWKFWRRPNPLETYLHG